MKHLFCVLTFSGVSIQITHSDLMQVTVLLMICAPLISFSQSMLLMGINSTAFLIHITYLGSVRFFNKALDTTECILKKYSTIIIINITTIENIS